MNRAKLLAVVVLAALCRPRVALAVVRSWWLMKRGKLDGDAAYGIAVELPWFSYVVQTWPDPWTKKTIGPVRVHWVVTAYMRPKYQEFILDAFEDPGSCRQATRCYKELPVLHDGACFEVVR